MTPIRHTCDELGACQRSPQCRHFCFGADDGHAECHLPCDGPPEPNRFPFAPGVIEGPQQAAPRDGRAVEVLAVLIALGAVVAVLGFATGYLNIHAGWLL